MLRSLPSTPLCPSPPHHFASQTHLRACKFPFTPDGSSYSYLKIREFPFTPDRSWKFPFIPEGTGVLVLMFEMSGVVEPSMLKSGYSTMWSCSNMPSYTRPFLNMNLPYKVNTEKPRVQRKKRKPNLKEEMYPSTETNRLLASKPYTNL